jgi:mono/diheme cytochrome c family protein
MIRHARIALVVSALVAAHAASAQQGSPPLDETQALGCRLFVQSCGVCHMSVQRTSARYGPALSQDSLGGRDEVLREVIANGTPRMPGFKHHFEGGEIDAIVAYLKTVPAPPSGAPQPGGSR